MATPNVGILTTAGKALIDKVNSGQAKISFSKVVFSSMDNSQLSDTQIKALTAIAPQEVVVSSPETTLDTNSGETRIRATGTNEKLPDGVYVKTYGVFAKDDTGSEILYGVTVSPNPNYFPAYDGVTPQAVTYSYKTVIQETSNITMTNSNDVYVSQKDLTEAIAAIPKPDLSNYATQQQLATKADDSKVVHSADMRKPASDVAGIEEVNAKQDKIGYTPADDSKVLHSTVTQLNSTDMNTVFTAGFYNLNSGTNGMSNADAWTIYQVIPLSYQNGVQLAYGTNNTILGMRSWNGNKGSRGFTSWVKFADDSKVVHNTGTEEIAGTKTFDTAPIDKTTGNPYITKDGVPTVDLSSYAKTSDMTTAISTATANMVDATKSTNFTAGLQSGGIDVATAADLKSIEDSAWREVTNSAFQGSYLFRDKQDGTASIAGTIYFTKPTQQYNGYDDYVIPMPDGYKAVGVASSGEINGFVNDLSVTVQGLEAYFPGTALHLYSDLSQNRPIAIVLGSFDGSSVSSITSGPLILKVTKLS